MVAACHVGFGQTVFKILKLFQFSRWLPSSMWDFTNREISLADLSGGWRCIIVPNFVEIGQSVAEKMSHFCSHLPSWIFYGILAPPTKSSCWSCHCIKFGCSRRSSFINSMKFSIFGTFGFKMSIYTPKMAI